jgi:hypothetical protein
VPQVGPPALPAGFRVVNLPSAGARLSVPRNWVQLGTHSSLLLVLDTSGGAVIALWRYPLQGPAPQGARQLVRARQRLIASARRRDHSLHVLSSTLGRVSGHPAITLTVDERIGKSQRRVVSSHVFTSSEELVLEEYAPYQAFGRVNRAAFSPVLRSLTLTG